MRWKPLGRTCSRKRRINSARLERHGRVASGPLDPVVLDFESDAVGIGRNQTAVGDSDAVGVAR